MITKLKQMSKSQWLAVLGATLILAALIMMPFVQAQATGSEQVGDQWVSETEYPGPTLAADGSIITVGESTTALGDKTASYTNLDENADDDVILTKDIAAVNGMANTFDITLTVVADIDTTQTTTVTSNAQDSATVLVLDSSGSMSSSNIEEMKKAAEAFINAYGENANGKKRMVSIVDFATDALALGSGDYWYNVANPAEKEEALKLLDSITKGGGTFLQGGLLIAKSLLDNTVFPATNNSHANPVVNFTDKNVVLMADGVPNYSLDAYDGYHSDWEDGNRPGVSNGPYLAEITPFTALYVQKGEGSGNSTEHQDTADALAVASYLKEDIYTAAKLYTVFFQTDSSDGTYLASLASEEAGKTFSYTAENSSELALRFKAISETITETTEATISGIVHDPMAEHITFKSFIDSNNNEVSTYTNATLAADQRSFEWTLTPDVNGDKSGSGDNAVYTYTIKYRIELDPTNLEEGSFYPTNDATSFKYGESPTDMVYFPVPTVKALFGELSFDKVNEAGDALQASFELLRSETADGVYAHYSYPQTATGLDAGKVELTGLPYGYYQLKETAAPAGYVLSDEVVSFQVQEGDIVGLMYGDDTAWNKEFINYYDTKPIGIDVEKTWHDLNAASRTDITFTLYQYTVNPFDNEGNVDYEAIGKTEMATLTLEAADIVGNDVWYGTFTGQFPTINANDGSKYYYAVQESTITGYSQTGYSLTPSSAADSTATASNEIHHFTNTLTTIPTIELDVIKNWYTPLTTGLDSIEITLTRAYADGSGGYITETTNGEADGTPWSKTETISLSKNAAGQYVGKTSELPMYNANLKAYKYMITEIASTGYTVYYNNQEVIVDGATTESFEISNIYNVGSTEIAGAKSWSIPEGYAKPSITITLLADGANAGKAAISLPHAGVEGDDAWAYSFGELPVYKWVGVDANDNNIIEASEVTGVKMITYTVEEAFAGGDAVAALYTSTVSGTNISNRYIGEQYDIILNKTWQGTDTPQITYTLSRSYADGAETKTETVATFDRTGNVNGETLITVPKVHPTTGASYTYTLAEAIPAGYYQVSSTGAVMADATTEGANDTITFGFVNAKSAMDTFTIGGQKVWLQPDDLAGNEPTVTITLSNNVNAETKTYTLPNNDDGTWTYSFTGLATHHQVTDPTDNSLSEVLIEYTVRESFTDADYTAAGSYQGLTIDANNKITDTINAETSYANSVNFINERNDLEEYTVDIEITKSWIGWPSAIDKPALEFVLMQGADEIASTDLAAGGSSATITVPKYDSAHNIIDYTTGYTVVENITTENYTTQFNGSVGNIIKDASGDDYSVAATNTFITTYAPISATKTWNAPADKIVDITVKLFQNDVEVVSVTRDTQDATNANAHIINFVGTSHGYDAAKGGWPVYDANGNPFNYEVVETAITGFNAPQYAPVGKFNLVSGGSVSITNNFNYENANQDIPVIKYWQGPTGGMRDTITINLHRADTDAIVLTQELTPAAGDVSNTITFNNVAIYDSASGEAIDYYASETFGANPSYALVTEYTEADAEEDLILTNRIIQDNTITVDVEKIWVDNTFVRPENSTVDVVLVIDTVESNDEAHTVTLGLGDPADWTYQWSGLPKYNANNQEISYSVAEVDSTIPEGYTAIAQTVKGEDGNFAATITNTYELYRYQVIREYYRIENGVSTKINTAEETEQALTEAQLATVVGNDSRIVTISEALANSANRPVDNGITYDYNEAASQPSTTALEKGQLQTIKLVYEDTIADAPELTIGKAVSDENPMLGETVSYTLTVTNTGNVTRDITVADTMFGNGALNIATDYAGSYTTNATSIIFEDVVPGGSFDITYDYLTTSRGDIANTATATMTGASDQSTVTINVREPGLGLTKTAQSSIVLGNVLSYTLTVVNDGNIDLQQVILADDMFDGRATNIAIDGVAVDMSATSTVYDVINNTLELGDMAAGASLTITYSYIPVATGPVINDAMVMDIDELSIDTATHTATVVTGNTDIERDPDPDNDDDTDGDVVEIEPDTTPLAPAPIVIEEPTTPLAPAPAEEVLIIEEETPLGNLPQTGAAGVSVQMMLAAGIMLLAISGLALIPKAKKAK